MTQYSNGYQYRFALTKELCEEMFPEAFLISLRLAKVFHIFFSIVSMIAISYFVLYCRSYLKFHFNVKIMFYFQFASCFLQSAVVALMEIHHLVVLMMAREYCDVVISPPVYQFFNMTFYTTSLATCVSLIVMVLERAFASFSTSFYERMSKKLGIVLAVLTGSITLSSAIYMFYGISFDFPQMSAFSSVPESTARVSIVFVTVLAIDVFTSILSIFLYRYNTRRRNSVNSRTSLKLSSKYQLCENLASSRVLWQLTSSQLSINLIYGVAINVIRFGVPKPRPAIWQAVADFIYIPPIYCAIMPLLCIYTIRKSQNDRNETIDKLIEMKTTGSEGWDNYKKVIQKQWK